ALVAFGIWALYEELSSVWIALNLIGGFLVGVVSAALCLWLCQALTESVGVWLAGAISVGGGWLAYALVTGLWLSSGDRFAPPIETTGDEVFA
ncbi:MAG: hypothetical protein KDD78_07350, partial [Caldilineaceae bacterium]|nr:hypothetical protein [Caldilineaceae bacterium]